jgi:hypothetical protein
MTRLPAPPLEHDEQVALIRWAALHEWHEPRLAMLWAVPNGGARHKATAAKLQGEGVRAGVPDLMLAVPSARGDHGLFIELKRLRGAGPTDAQRAMLAKLRRHGYRAEVCRGWVAAANVIADYLDRPDLAPEDAR